MKYKTLLMIGLVAQLLAFFITALAALSSVGSLKNVLRDIDESVTWKVTMALCTIIALVGFFIIVGLLLKLEALTIIENQEAELETEKQKFKQATDHFLKTFKIKTDDLLN